MENYKIIKQIGKGNYGQAYLSRSKKDNNLYVIKTIDISNFNKEQLDNALYEVNVLKSLNHPYIIKHIESFYEKNFLCIVMEYADCGDMSKLVISQQKIGVFLKEDIILNWFVQICFAVKYIHEQKILHRDLKLSNIFLCSSGDIKIGDFGIAKILNNMDEYAKTLVGTPYFLSPELCLKKAYNQKSDIWSIGCVLYELMFLRHAFEANNNLGELILKILKGEFGKMNDGNFSKESKQLVKDILVTDYNKRPGIDQILKINVLKKYIKMNLIKQICKNQMSNENLIEKNINIIKNKYEDQKENLSNKYNIEKINKEKKLNKSPELKNLFIKQTNNNNINNININKINNLQNINNSNKQNINNNNKNNNNSDSNNNNLSELKNKINLLLEENITLKSKLQSSSSNSAGIVETHDYFIPPYSFEKLEKNFIVTIEVSDIVKDLKCSVNVIEGNYFFKFSGLKIINNQIQKNNKNCFYFNNRKEGKFQIEFTIPIKDLQLEDKNCKKLEHENGVYKFYFDINTNLNEQIFNI